MGLFKSASRPAKTDPVERALTRSLPPGPPRTRPVKQVKVEGSNVFLNFNLTLGFLQGFSLS